MLGCLMAAKKFPVGPIFCAQQEQRDQRQKQLQDFGASCCAETGFCRQAEAERPRKRQTCQRTNKFSKEPTRAMSIIGMRIAAMCILSASLTTPRAEANAVAPMNRRMPLSARNALQTL